MSQAIGLSLSLLCPAQHSEDRGENVLCSSSWETAGLQQEMQLLSDSPNPPREQARKWMLTMYVSCLIRCMREGVAV